MAAPSPSAPQPAPASPAASDRALDPSRAAALAPAAMAQSPAGVTRYVRYRFNNQVQLGILDGDNIRQLRGNLFANPTETGTRHPFKQAKLLSPIESPSKILALAGNYRSHLGTRAPATNRRACRTQRHGPGRKSRHVNCSRLRANK